MVLKIEEKGSGLKKRILKLGSKAIISVCV